MDNQTITPGGAPTQPTPPTEQQPSLQSFTPTPSAPKQRGKTILIVLLVLALLGAGALGFLYYQTNTSLKKKSQELAKAHQTVEQFQSIVDGSEAASKFIAAENNAEMSRRMCGGKPMLMSDVHINDSFAVFRYLCGSLSYEAPIRIGAMKKMPDGSYEFTYGASTLNPDGLPDFIYNSEPEFFGGAYGATLF